MNLWVLMFGKYWDVASIATMKIETAQQKSITRECIRLSIAKGLEDCK